MSSTIPYCNSSKLESADHNNDTKETLENQPAAAWEVDQTSQRPTGSEDHEYSEMELVYLLQDRKAAEQATLLQNIHGSLMIKNFDANQEMDPIHILRTLGVDLNDKKLLGDCYYFFCNTKYPKNRALATRDRSISTNYGPCCWSQGGGGIPIIDRAKRRAIGVKRKFTLFKKPASYGKKSLRVGSNVYCFQLHEFATVEDEEEGKRMISLKQIPLGFLCLYKLIPNLISKTIEPEEDSLITASSRSLHEKDEVLHETAAHLPLGGPDLESVPSELLIQKSAAKVATDGDLEPVSVEATVHDAMRESTAASKIETDVDEHTSRQLDALYSPDDWNFPRMLFIPGHLDRYDQQWLSPYKKSLPSPASRPKDRR